MTKKHQPAVHSRTDTGHLVRVMGIWTLALYGVGDMLGAGIYGLIGKAAGQLGNAIWLAFVASMLAALFTGLSYAEAGSRYPRAAGAAYVVYRAFKTPFLSYLVGLVTTASGLTSIAAGSRVFAGYLQAALGVSYPLELFVVGFILLLTLVNFWGMRQSVWLNVLCTLIEVGGLLIVLAVGMRYWGSVDYFETPTLANSSEQVSLSMLLILQGAVLTFYSFVGFEDMLNVTEEVKNPQQTFPKALILALAITTIIYIAISITAVSVVPHAQLAQSKQPLVDVVISAAPWFPPIIFSIISMFAVTNTALLNYIMGSRLLYGMSRQKLLPSGLSKVHPKRHTPHLAILTILGVVMTLALSGDISALAKATSVLLLCVFIIVNSSLIILKRRPGEPQGSFRVPIVVPMLGILVCASLLTNAGETEFMIAAIIVGVVTLLYFVSKPKKLDEKQLAALD